MSKHCSMWLPSLWQRTSCFLMWSTCGDVSDLRSGEMYTLCVNTSLAYGPCCVGHKTSQKTQTLAKNVLFRHYAGLITRKPFKPVNCFTLWTWKQPFMLNLKDDKAAKRGKETNKKQKPASRNTWGRKKHPQLPSSSDNAEKLSRPSNIMYISHFSGFIRGIYLHLLRDHAGNNGHAIHQT